MLLIAINYPINVFLKLLFFLIVVYSWAFNAITSLTFIEPVVLLPIILEILIALPLHQKIFLILPANKIFYVNSFSMPNQMHLILLAKSYY